MRNALEPRFFWIFFIENFVLGVVPRNAAEAMMGVEDQFAILQIMVVPTGIAKIAIHPAGDPDALVEEFRRVVADGITIHTVFAVMSDGLHIEAVFKICTVIAVQRTFTVFEE